MNVKDLIALLAQYDEDAEVRLATQPSWPLQYQIAGVASLEEVVMGDQCDEHGNWHCDECAENAPAVVYIAEGNGFGDDPYASSAVWEVAS